MQISPGNVEALVDSGAYVGYKKVQIQIRLRAKDYSKNAIALERGEAIIDQVNDIFFPADFLKALNSTSHAQDHIDFSRFGWMMPGYDIVLSSVTGFPISASDKNPDYLEDQVLIPSGDASSAREEQLKLILFGVLLAAAMLISLVVCLYFRLRRQYWDLEKDKGLPGNLRAMWER